MNPQEAKTKIEAYLNLGTLRGVKVEYENGYINQFLKTEIGIIKILGTQKLQITTKDDYTNIKSIHPIPLEPKLLEVGTRVKIIGGEHEGKFGEISLAYAYNYGYSVGIDNSIYTANIACHYVVPESLLVEEQESQEEEDFGKWYVEFIKAHKKEMLAELKKYLEQEGYKLTKE